MSSSLSFGGSSFSLYSTTLISPNIIRVAFTQIPLQASPVGVADSLNISNWTVGGPASNPIAQILTVSSDPYSIDFVFTNTLISGTWTLTGSTAITTVGAVNLSAPLSGNVTVTASGSVSSLNPGATNDSASDIIRKHFNPYLKGPNWDALIAGLSYSDDINATNAQSAFDQYFKVSASGKYLTILAAGDGTERPSSVGFNDEDFRQLAIKSPFKVTHQALREILSIYYGKDQTNAYVDTTLTQPFALQDGQYLDLLIDGVDSVRIYFTNANASILGQATALEVAAAISKGLYDAGLNAFAVSQLDTATGLYKVRIYSGSEGLKSFIKVVGGTAQPFLQFPTLVNVYGVFTSATWTYTTLANGNTQLVRNSLNSTDMNVSSVQAGDYVVIGTTANVGTTGVYTIASVDVQWSGSNYIQTIQLTSQVPVAAGPYTQTTTLGYTFFRPTIASIKNDNSGVFLSQTALNSLEINLPATSKVVSRGVLTASYGNVNSTVKISRLLRNAAGLVTVTTSAAHNLETGTQAFISDFTPAQSYPWIAPNKTGAVWGPIETPDVTSGAVSDYIRDFPGVAKLSTGDILIAGGFATVTGTPETASNKCVRLVTSSTLSVADGSDANGISYRTNTWGTVPNMTSARTEFGLTALSGSSTNSVIAVGGINGSTILATSEIYNATSNTWSAGPNLPKEYPSGLSRGKACHQQVLLADGRLWVGGGIGQTNEASNGVYLYDNKTNSFGYPKSLVSSAGASGNLKIARSNFKAVRLLDGRVFIAGGRLLPRTVDVDSTLWNYWGLDEFSGTSLVNYGTNTTALTTSGTVTILTPGKIKNARSFAAAASATAFGDTTQANIFNSGTWSIDGWVNAWPASKVIFTYRSSLSGFGASNNYLCQIGIDASSKLFVLWQNGVFNTVTATSTASNPFPSGLTTWAHFAVTSKAHSPADGLCDVDFYVNGQNVGTVTNLALSAGGSSANYNLATDPNPSATLGNFANGIDDFKIYSRALTQFDVRKNFMAGLGDNPAWKSLAGGANIPKSTEVTNTCEIWDPTTETSTLTTSMAMARSDFEMQLLDDGRVLIIGGYGYSPTGVSAQQNALGSTTWDSTTLFSWPTISSIPDCEIYDPTTRLFSKISPMATGKAKFWSVKIPGKNKILVGGYQSQVWEVLDLTTMKWSLPPWLTQSNLVGPNTYNHSWAFSDGGWVLLGGGIASSSFTKGTYLAPGGGDVSASGGINGLFPVTVIDSTNFTYQSPIKAYTNSHGAITGNQPVTTSGSISYSTSRTTSWNATSATRASNVTALTVSNPTGITTFPFAVGDIIFFDSDNVTYLSGLKTLTAVTSNTISFADVGANAGPTGINGIVNRQYGFGTSLEVQAYANTVNVGPYIFNPNSYTINAGISTLSAALGKDINYRSFDIQSPGFVADSAGYVVFDFGGPLQSQPIPYIETFPNGSGGITVLVNNFVPSVNYPAGTSISTISSIVPAQPSIQTGAFYMTDSSAGRVNAQNQLEEAVAAGESVTINVAYPGDRGLGGAGATNSDKKWVWGK